ncbi:MFS transporter [Persephonella atlantica]|uniref:MFS transporter n=1 Tax=Persephonella atlantica TaxID=2699429 RepID=A0ABS1GGY3_9AQUI|nr:MFS transporter [Persephonella atlantica]MBK3332007.1 MFS transporter [Persephonella atlantica]
MNKIRVLSWALFDFAETVFSSNIISVFFPLWIVNTLGGSSYHYSLVYSVSIAISIMLGVVSGKIADERGLKDIFFKFFIVGVIFSIFSLYFIKSLIPALIMFLFMNIFYQQSLIFYNSLLEDVSGGKNRGLVSGSGIGIGYIGGVVSLLVANYLSDTPSQTFLITAIIFSLFSLPSLIFVKIPQKRALQISIRELFREKKFFLFLLSVLFLTDAAHGLIIFMSVYLNKVFNMSQSEIVNIIAFAGIFAIISAPVAGYILDRISPAGFLKFLFIGWMVGFVMLYFSNDITIYLVAILFGILLSSLWTTMRLVVIEISPYEQLTTRFAFMALSERMASIVSPLTWGVIVFLLGDNSHSYKVAAITLSIFPLIGFLVYMRFLRLT